MLSKEENEALCRVGPGTLMGDLVRQYWLPFYLSDDLEADGAPERVRLCGEDLIVFRATSGQVGLVGNHCRTGAHRCSLGATRRTGCAACTTAGSSTWPATASICRTSRPRATSSIRFTIPPTPAASATA